MTVQNLYETSHLVATIIEEAEDKLPKGVIARLSITEAQRAGIKNGNGRIYTPKWMKQQIADLNIRAAEGDVLMNANHPPKESNDPPIAGPNGIAGILREAVFDESTGVVNITKVDLPDTTAGRDIKAIVKAGGRIPVSSRSTGTAVQGVYTTATGEKLEGQIVQEGSILKTFDFVSYPSVTTARTSSMRESEQAEEPTMNEETLKKEHPDLYEKIQEDAKKSYHESMMAEVAKKIEEREDEIRSEIQAQLTESQNDNLVKLNESLEENKTLKAELKLLKSSKDSISNEIKDRLQKLEDAKNLNEAQDFIQSKTKDHPFGEQLRERCKDVKTKAEAEKVLSESLSLLESVVKKHEDLKGGKGIVNLDEHQEKDKTTSVTDTTKMSAAERANYLAGRK